MLTYMITFGKKMCMSNRFQFGIYVLGSLGACIGGYNGIEHWIQWYAKYIPVTFKSVYFQHYSPMVNSTVCGGKLVYDIAHYAFVNAIVAVTFPISVPMLLYFCEKK
jgi:hypothetical protein